MKRVLCILLCTLLALLTGCSQEQMHYTIYSDLNFATSDGSPEADSNVTFGDFSNLDLSSRDMYTREDADATKTFTVNGVEYEGYYSCSYSSTFASSANATWQPYGYYDMYRFTDSKIGIAATFRQYTGELVFICLKTDCSVSGNFSDEEAEKLAYSMFTSLYSPEYAAAYTCEVFRSESSSEEEICVNYVKYLCGYPTTDSISFTFNTKGEFKSFNAYDLGTVQLVESEISSKMITNAEEVLADYFPSWNIHNKELAVGASGTCYLIAYTSRPNGKSVTPRVFFINVN